MAFLGLANPTNNQINCVRTPFGTFRVRCDGRTGGIAADRRHLGEHFAVQLRLGHRRLQERNEQMARQLRRRFAVEKRVQEFAETIVVDILRALDKTEDKNTMYCTISVFGSSRVWKISLIRQLKAPRVFYIRLCVCFVCIRQRNAQRFDAIIRNRRKHPENASVN